MVELAVVLPTFKERENVAPVLAALERALAGIHYEVIFVDDDSPDETAELIRGISLRDPRVRVLQRIHRRGLSSACVEGMMATAAPYIAVMDADLQHDETILPAMLATLKQQHLDLVIASRNMPGGSMGDFSRERVAISGFGKTLSRMVCRCELSDPMSGFFLLDRAFVHEVVRSVSAIGFKILVDLVASCRRPVRFAEVPYRFRTRQRGESKLDIMVLIEYLQLVLDKMVGDLIPARFLLFSVVGALGALLNMAALAMLFRWFGLEFTIALGVATFLAMTSNFFLNNTVTYRDRRLKGSMLWLGLVSFYAVCSVGGVITIMLSEFLRRAGLAWYTAGAIAVVITSVWNFSITQLVTWRLQRRRHASRSAPQQA
ncbi:MAG: glycosyltransferase family 2 protein [Planctomycetes bacterium]|nr:glycosyltransferase family 2 protein [Planctomycetota bacterium]